MSHALVLLAHGSGDLRWRAPFDALAVTLAERHTTTPVRLAYMELCEPSLETIVAELTADGVTHTDILPLFFAAGRHLREDVPRQLEALQSTYPGISLHLLSPVGEHPAFIDALVGIIDERSRSQDLTAK